MSKPKYLRRDIAPSSIIVYIEELIKYIFAITNNEKQFPKALRYTLIVEIRKCCLKMYTATYKALNIKPRYYEQYKKRVKCQKKVYKRIVELKGLLIIALGVANVQNVEYLSALLDKVVEYYNKWVKNDRRTYHDLPTYNEYVASRERRLERRKRIQAEWNALPRDNDGFVILSKITSEDT